jgi:predicted RNA-binding protein YlxR (DUF448 family)
MKQHNDNITKISSHKLTKEDIENLQPGMSLTPEVTLYASGKNIITFKEGTPYEVTRIMRNNNNPVVILMSEIGERGIWITNENDKVKGGGEYFIVADEGDEKVSEEEQEANDIDKQLIVNGKTVYVLDLIARLFKLNSIFNSKLTSGISKKALVSAISQELPYIKLEERKNVMEVLEDEIEALRGYGYVGVWGEGFDEIKLTSDGRDLLNERWRNIE